MWSTWCVLTLWAGLAVAPTWGEVPADFLVFGPGIESADLIFPSRYFFLLSRVEFGKVELKHPTGRSKGDQACQPWTRAYRATQFCLRPKDNHTVGPQITQDNLGKLFVFCEVGGGDDQSDRDYRLSIVRYSFHGQPQCRLNGLELVVSGEGGDVLHRQAVTTTDGQSLIHSEVCSVKDRNNWAKQMRCNSNANKHLSKQIASDLKIFNKGLNFTYNAELASKLFAPHPLSYAYCHYKIIANKPYKKCYGKYDGFSRFYDEMLLSLLRKTSLDDTEFLMNLGDYPLSMPADDDRQSPLAIFSWCGSTDTHDIVLPTYELTEQLLQAQGRASHDLMAFFGQQSQPFAGKINKFFWRGRDSHRQRLTLARLAQRRPDLFNASITNFFFFKDEAAELSQGKSYVPLTSFFDYRYQLNIDGTVAAYRLPSLLASDSLVVKQSSKFYEFFYRALRPGVHLLEIDEDIGQLENLAECLLKLNDNAQQQPPVTCAIRNVHDEDESRAGERIENLSQIKQIVWRARLLVLTNLLPENIYCYYYNALHAYTSLLQKAAHKVELAEDFEPVATDKEAKAACVYETTPEATDKEEL